MAMFEYVGVDRAGEKKSGLIQADREALAISILGDRGISVSEIKKKRESATSPQSRVPAASHTEGTSQQTIPVRVVDFDMDFATMVWFMVKWAIAAIPAAIILGVIMFGLFTLFAALAIPLTR